MRRIADGLVPRLALALALAAGAAAAQPSSGGADAGLARLLRMPDIAGDTLVFVHGGDLWVAPADGGTAVLPVVDDPTEVVAVAGAASTAPAVASTAAVARSRRALPWRPIAVAAACFVAGFVLVALLRAGVRASGLGDLAPVDAVPSTTVAPTTAAPTTTAPPPTTAAPADDDHGGGGRGNGRARDRDRDDD